MGFLCSFSQLTPFYQSIETYSLTPALVDIASGVGKANISDVLRIENLYLNTQNRSDVGVSHFRFRIIGTLEDSHSPVRYELLR